MCRTDKVSHAFVPRSACPVASQRNNDRECRGPYYARVVRPPRRFPTSFLRLLPFLTGPRVSPLPLPLVDSSRSSTLTGPSRTLFLFLLRLLTDLPDPLPLRVSFRPPCFSSFHAYALPLFSCALSSFFCPLFFLGSYHRPLASPDVDSLVLSLSAFKEVCSLFLHL